MPLINLKKDELSLWCKELIKKFKDKQIILLEGPLGAGKTEIVKTFVRLMGGEESSSPTYSLINEYNVSGKRIFHIDLYRVEDDEDLESIGFWDLFEAEQGLIFIEWSNRLKQDDLPFDWSKLGIKIEKKEDDSLREYELFDFSV